jgi:hypothetical protein
MPHYSSGTNIASADQKLKLGQPINPIYRAGISGPFGPTREEMIAAHKKHKKEMRKKYSLSERIDLRITNLAADSCVIM